MLGNNQVGFQVGSYDHHTSLTIDPVLTSSTYFGGAGNDSAYGVAVDASGSIYVTGETQSTTLPSLDPKQASLIGTSEVFISKFDSTGQNLLYTSYLGSQIGGGTNAGHAIAVDASGNAFVVGTTSATDYPVTQGAYQSSLRGASNAFVTELGAKGDSLVLSSYFGGSGNDQALGVALGAALPAPPRQQGPFGLRARPRRVICPRATRYRALPNWDQVNKASALLSI